jgi:hypothetical protein
LQPGQQIKTSLSAVVYEGSGRVTGVAADGTVQF